MLAYIQKRYWIIHPVASIRQIIRQCVICKKRNLKVATQQMADLPDYRVPSGERVEPFSSCAIDCAGPFFVSRGRGRTREKRYICIFRCAMFSAVHIETLTNLDTDTFIMALDRFLTFYQKPRLLIADNGTNFVSSRRELRAMAKMANWEESQMERLSSRRLCRREV